LKADDVLEALRRHHSTAAIVPEVVISDDDWVETWAPGQIFGSVRRIDGLMFSSYQRTAIEIKVSKADFNREDDRKRRPWQRVVHRFVYAAPRGLLTYRDIPYGCGLWEVDDTGRVTVAKKSKINQHPEHLPQQVVQALAYRAAKNSGKT
jgi:hypothetical protein